MMQPDFRLRHTGLVVGLCLVGIASGLHAQTRSPAWRLWAAGGLGGGSSDAEGGFAGLAEIAFQRAPHQLAVRAIGMIDPSSEPCGDGQGDIALMYGRTLTGAAGHVTLASGVAYTVTSTCGTSRGSRYVPGLPLAFEAAVRIAPVLGLGAQIFGNINPRASFGGLTVFVQVGWMPR